MHGSGSAITVPASQPFAAGLSTACAWHFNVFSSFVAAVGRIRGHLDAIGFVVYSGKRRRAERVHPLSGDAALAARLHPLQALRPATSASPRAPHQALRSRRRTETANRAPRPDRVEQRKNLRRHFCKNACGSGVDLGGEPRQRPIAPSRQLGPRLLVGADEIEAGRPRAFGCAEVTLHRRGRCR